MQNKKEAWARAGLLGAMAVWGTLSLFVKPLAAAGCSSAMIVWARAAIGALFLLVVHFIRRQKFDRAALRRHGALLAVSGVCMAGNWILLFESYNHTSVSVSTVCYYTAPVIFMVGTFFFFRERVSVKKIACIVMALVGLFFVSFDFSAGFVGGVGIVCASGAAVLYATVILCNRYMSDIPGTDRTLFQLVVAVVAVLPYVIGTAGFYLPAEPIPILCLLALGVVHTGFALTAYFYSVGVLAAQTVALFSYLDPVVALLLSATVLGEGLSVPVIIGIVLIIGASVWSEIGHHPCQE